MLSIGTNDRQAPITQFDLVSLLQLVEQDPNRLAQLLGSTDVLSSTSRITPREHEVPKGIVLFKTRFDSSNSGLIQKWKASIVSRILALRPSSAGGVVVQRTFGELLTGPAIFELAADLELSADQREKLATAPFLNGKIFMTHSEWDYDRAVAKILDVLGTTFLRYVDKNIFLFIDSEHPLYSKQRLISGAELGRSIAAMASPRLTVSRLPYYWRSPPGVDVLDSESLRSNLLNVWAGHFNRPAEQVGRAARKYRMVNRSSRDASELFKQIFDLEALTVEAVDQLTSGSAGEESSEAVLRQIGGVDTFVLDDSGFQIERKSNAASVNLADVAAKHRLALAAFRDFRSYVGSLDNTYYRAFMRFVQPLDEAIGETADQTDTVMLAGLSRPLARLLVAANADEARQQDSRVREFEPIPQTVLAQLEWLAEAVLDLVSSFKNTSDFEEGRNSISITEQNLQNTKHHVHRLVEELEPTDPEIADRFAAFLAMDREAEGKAPELAHAILSGVHNLMVVALEAVERAHKTKIDAPPSTVDVPERARIGWDAFRAKMGENIADRLTGLFGVATFSVAVVIGWFTGAGPALANEAPQIFRAIHDYLISLSRVPN